VKFNEKVSGYAAAPANYVADVEQLNPGGGCASTYVAENAKGVGTNVFAFDSKAVTPNHSFSVTVHFYSANHGSHGMCSYLINKTTRTTYAHGSIFWSNA
jgi:hypothetical protein